MCRSQKLNMLSISNVQLSLFLMSTKSYLKFRTIRGTPQKWVGFGKPLFRSTQIIGWTRYRIDQVLSNSAVRLLSWTFCLVPILHTSMESGLTLSWPSCCRHHMPSVGGSWRHWRQGQDPPRTESPPRHSS